ncbi:hypothetical protein AB0P21_15565 [Kribbella sp. NPDC056861]|uniref:hypothetical protein n=1 Tax=Kribbella sp. NPDC056861 TaxID=3154857 RepID=UPI00343E8E5B
MTALPPDEELPLKLAGLERELAVRQHRWFALAMLLTAIGTGVTLLLPWTYSRRLGLSVWQLGIETQPALALTWAAGLIATGLALALPVGLTSQAASGVSGVITVVFVAGCWQTRDLSPLSDTWPGPGPTFAMIIGLSWLLATAAHLLATRTHAVPPTPEALEAAQTRLRRSRRPSTRSHPR